MHKRAVLFKTLKVAAYTFASKGLGFVRELLTQQYLGAGALADAFIVAFKIPNSLRAIFAEGALSAAFVPTLVETLKKEGHAHAQQLITAVFLSTQTVLALLCGLMVLYSRSLLCGIVPGWFSMSDGTTVETAVTLLHILMYYVLFISASSVIAGALQAEQQFSVPASSQVVMNVLTVMQLLGALYYNLSIYVYAACMLVNGIVVFALHVYAYAGTSLWFAVPTRLVLPAVKRVFAKFIPCFISLGIMEINFLIDQGFASYLPTGAIALLKYSSDFMRIPLGVFAVSFATILLPHLSRVSVHHVKRLPFYVYHSVVCITWITLPVMLLMIFFSYDIFATTFLLSTKFTLAHVYTAQQLLCIFVIGLLFFSVNKIITNVYYAVHQTLVPTFFAVFCAALNTALNYFFICLWSAQGVAAATIIAAIIQTGLLLYGLQKMCNIPFAWYSYIQFLVRYSIQILCIAGPCSLAYALILFVIKKTCQERVAYIITQTLVLWVWVAPLCMVFLGLLYFTRKRFGVKVHFLN